MDKLQEPYDPRTFKQATFHDAVPGFLDGSDTPRAYLERCLETIEAREPIVKAWATLRVDGARADADLATTRYKMGKPLSSIDGMPIGIKDLIETKDMHQTSSIDATGARVPFSPKVTATVGGVYSWNVGAGKVLLGANVYYSGFYTYEAGGTFDQPTYTTLSAHLDWAPGGGHVTYSLWGKNITDRAYYNGYYTATTLMGHSWAPPAEAGVAFDYKY